ncbi:hypothetical protein HYPSUDRAFT_771505 [Hypholoma sublateritium FD-334 SS-4]|uniref:Uncharacterized protein n=1 Tax=Hypholoma sublateritium (strain FD-334 SS-4) TaxID=945553 RepID=A0A0D2PLC5_HYPSF|nr:hypothetical protein HYPSUDRAFT_771505 [Hypholoma sublateritium FD-334 SS-4]
MMRRAHSPRAGAVGEPNIGSVLRFLATATLADAWKLWVQCFRIGPPCRYGADPHPEEKSHATNTMLRSITDCGVPNPPGNRPEKVAFRQVGNDWNNACSEVRI